MAGFLEYVPRRFAASSHEPRGEGGVRAHHLDRVLLHEQRGVPRDVDRPRFSRSRQAAA